MVKQQEYIFKCKKCGKEYSLFLTENSFNKSRYTKFCSRSCANSRIRTDEIKEKITKGVLKYYYKDGNKCTRQQLINAIKKYQNQEISFNDIKKHFPDAIKICSICGKEFVRDIQKCGKRVSNSKTCSQKCHKQLKIINGYKAHEIALKNGTFKPWQSRKIISYPEKFWMTVLKNNNIDYIHNYHFENKYFLDFYIIKGNIKIDLGIDGKQHKYLDRIKQDKIRDIFVKDKNVKVYRIPWNEINTKNGKEKMKNKIDQFMQFYNNI